MPVSQRSYTPSDLPAMLGVAQAAASVNNLHLVDLPYRFSSWAFDDPENIRLWQDEDGRLLAWVALQTPFWTIDYACLPDLEAALHPRLLAWADARASQVSGGPYARPAWFVSVYASQAQRRRDLEAAGFQSQADVGEDSWTKVQMRRPTDAPLKPYAPPPGYEVRPLRGESEVEAYVELHRAVFGSKNMTVAWRQRTLSHPDYSPDLDLVVAAPDGRLAAFCIGWLRPQGNAAPLGQIEPLGCRQEFRRYALGRVALAEALRRLQGRGAQSILVETDNYRNTALSLYESVGFAVINEVLVYRKDYPSPSSAS